MLDTTGLAGTDHLPVDGLAQVCIGCPSMRDPATINAIHLVSVRDASLRTGIPRRTIYHWIKTGKLWSIVITDRIMLHEDDVTTMELVKAS